MAEEIKQKYSNGNLVFYEGSGPNRTTTGYDLLSISPTLIQVGSSSNDVDLKVMLGSGTEYVLFDAGNSRVAFGYDGEGVDARFYGDTASAYMLWDESTDDLKFYGVAQLDFDNIDTTPDSSRTYIAWHVGRRGAANEIDVTIGSGSNQNFDPIQMNLNIIGSNPGNSSTINSIYQLITHDTTDMANIRLKCADWNIVAAKNIKDAYVIQTELDIVGNVTIGGEAFAVSAYLNAGTGTYTVNDRLAALFAIVSGTATVTGTYNVAHFFASANAAVDSVLELQTISTASADSAIFLDAAGTITSFINTTGETNVTNFLETTAEAGFSGATRGTPNQTATCDGSVKVLIGAKTLFIPLYNAITIS